MKFPIIVVKILPGAGDAGHLVWPLKLLSESILAVDV